jgi:hypothetical protein
MNPAFRNYPTSFAPWRTVWYQEKWSAVQRQKGERGVTKYKGNFVEKDLRRLWRRPTVCRSKDNSDLDCAEVECHNGVWTELTRNKWLPWVWIHIKYFQAEKICHLAGWKEEYKQFWTVTIGKIRKRTGRNIELGVTRIEFLRFKSSASGWLSSALFRCAARSMSVWHMSNIMSKGGRLDPWRWGRYAAPKWRL